MILQFAAKPAHLESDVAQQLTVLLKISNVVTVK
jgi:hypothetical protein